MKYEIDPLELNADVVERLRLLPLPPALVDSLLKLIALKATVEALGGTVIILSAAMEIDVRKPPRFRPLNRDYWLKTYPALNPFVGPPYCPRCGFIPAFSRSWMEANGAVEHIEFRCVCGHSFERTKVWD